MKRLGLRPDLMDKGRFDAFTDGVFAIAVTLLVLEIHPLDLTASDPAALDRQMRSWIAHLGPQLLTYALSFATVGIIWLNHHAAFGRMRHVDRTMAALNLVLLGFVCLIPYPTALVARYGALPASTAFYGVTFFLMGASYGLLFRYATRLQQRREGGAARITGRQVFMAQLGTFTYLAGALVAFRAPAIALAVYVLTTAYYAVPGLFSPGDLDQPPEPT